MSPSTSTFHPARDGSGESAEVAATTAGHRASAAFTGLVLDGAHQVTKAIAGSRAAGPVRFLARSKAASHRLAVWAKPHAPHTRPTRFPESPCIPQHTLLDDGIAARTRHACAADYPLVEDLKDRCHPDSLRARFAGRARLAEGDWHRLVSRPDSLSLITTVAGHPDHAIALSHLLNLSEEPGTGEIALLVADDWQGRGLGSALADLHAKAARANGFHTIYAYVAASNAAALRVLERVGTPVCSDEDAVCEQLGMPCRDDTGYRDLRIALHGPSGQGA
ncbi:GNAT family N-acetyltransferase [Streptomyces sp. NBC_00470]|uniref:GNAT family N-acetyltransferase n=1 Tax=Streptomyces sp. NBC_00470 TaxID=2975753 RepID=UPI002F91028A